VSCGFTKISIYYKDPPIVLLVFKIKMKNGVIDKYKVRIVAKGYNQILDLDYNESFAPVARFNTLRIFLAISLAKKHKRKSIDVVAAYFNSRGDVLGNPRWHDV